ncbi:MAG: hypothetical protein M0R77_11335 [Gammaproteobacteria bacterium]|nr:hypothetical protein [Gammaproteobacteria bacterium]
MARHIADEAAGLVEPPRDGEFFLDEAPGVDERMAGAIERAMAGTARWVTRFPVLSLGLAVGFGVVVSSAAFNLI